MSFGVLVIRRFNVKAEGRAHNRELRRRVELPVPPVEGLWVDFGDGTGTAQLAHVTARALAGGTTGILPDLLEARTRTEPAERLEPALAAGWLPVDDLAPDAAGRPPATTPA